MGRRTLLLIASILIAAVGTTLVYVYARTADQRALGDQQTVTILVTRDAIQAGGALNPQAVEKQAVAAVAAPPGYITSPADVEGELAVRPLPAGSALVTTDFAAPGKTGPAYLPADKVAVTVTLTDPARVALLLKPGSRVALYSDAPSDSAEGVYPLLPVVTVLAVGSDTTAGVPTPIPSIAPAARPATEVTLELAPPDAAKVLYASSTGTLYFAVLGEKVEEAPAQPGNSKTVFGSGL
jgi:pilus assembly protein CpaB